MSGSFMLFCLGVFVVTVLFMLARRRAGNPLRQDAKVCLLVSQALTITGAASEPLVHYFDGSVAKGVAAAALIGVVYLIALTRAVSDRLVCCSASGIVLINPDSLQENSEEHREQEEE